jgi:CheY-like chemotaxis protein
MKKLILVVDDEQDVREFLRDLLEDQEYSVRVAEDGIQGLEMIEREKPDLILLDLQMPRQTGTDMYRKIHQRKESRNIPVIIISGLPGRHLAVSKSVPVFDKPIDEKRLLEEVKNVIG